MTNRKMPKWLVVTLVIIFIVILIVTAGTLFAPELPQDEEQKKKAAEEEAKLRELERLNKINALIEELATIEADIISAELKIEQIKVNEKRVLFASRVIVAILMLGLDYLYYRYFHLKVNRELVWELLKFNSSLVAGYSFLAFITHGTPAKFANYLKIQIRSILHWYHKASYTKYEYLKINRSITRQILEGLQK